MQYDFSVVIPANHEEFLKNTVEDVIKNKRAKTEVIVVLDGGVWADPPIPQHPDVQVIYCPTTIGQRAAADLGVRLSTAKYVSKMDAHCGWDEGFDQKMLDAFKVSGDNVTMVGIMKNLHAFDWICQKCGNKWYQGPTPKFCFADYKATIKNQKCDSKEFKRKITWEPRRGTHSVSYSFDAEPHFQYFHEYKSRPEYVKMKEETGLTECMSLQGSFFMTTRENYWKLRLGGDFGSWGNQGIQVALATWLSGERVLVNHNTWYMHMFRTQGGDFGFPYVQSGNAVQKTKQKVWDFFTNGKWKRQIHPVSWLIDRFKPIPGWSENDILKLKEKERNNVFTP